MLDYFAIKAINASAIKAGAISMLKMQHEIERGTDATSAMMRGSLQHMAILEPEKFAVLHVEEYDGRTKAGKELVERIGKENIIKPAEHAELIQAQKMVFDHPAVVNLGLFETGETEKEIYWNEAGIDCKAKLDFLSDNYWIEYKTTSTLQSFTRKAAGMFYQLQLGWYSKAAYNFDKRPRKCYVIAQEQKAPFDVAVFEVSAADLARWQSQCMDIVSRYVSGDRSGAFPALMSFELPAWADSAADVELSGDDLQF